MKYILYIRKESSVVTVECCQRGLVNRRSRLVRVVNSLCWMFNAAILGRDKVRCKRVPKGNREATSQVLAHKAATQAITLYKHCVESFFCGPSI